MNGIKEISLESIADGVAAELFEHELKKVAENIADMNTSAKTKRKITLTFTFEPDDMRGEARVSVNAKTSLASVKPFTKTVFCGKKNGKHALYGQDTKQISMFDQNVTPLGGANA